jgi:hypothetical protein
MEKNNTSKVARLLSPNNLHAFDKVQNYAVLGLGALTANPALTVGGAFGIYLNSTIGNNARIRLNNGEKFNLFRPLDLFKSTGSTPIKSKEGSIFRLHNSTPLPKAA